MGDFHLEKKNIAEGQLTLSEPIGLHRDRVYMKTARQTMESKHENSRCDITRKFPVVSYAT